MKSFVSISEIAIAIAITIATLLFILHLGIIPAFAETEGDFVYISGGEIGVDENTSVIAKYTGKGGDVNIPSRLGGKPVAYIGDRAFMDLSAVTSVTIPDSVIQIGGYAFYGCTALKSVSIPKNVTVIGEFAFFGCKSLTAISIPDGITSIEGYAFNGCEALTNITVPDGVTNIGEFAFAYCKGAEDITVADSVAVIGPGVFRGCEKLTVTGGADSAVRDYAKGNGIRFRIAGTDEIDENTDSSTSPLPEISDHPGGGSKQSPGKSPKTLIWFAAAAGAAFLVAAGGFIYVMYRRKLLKSGGNVTMAEETQKDEEK